MTPVNSAKGLKKAALLHAVAVERAGKTPFEPGTKQRAGTAASGELLTLLTASLRSVPPLLFVSYSHKDAKDVDSVITHLRALKNAGKVQLWSDDRLRGGDVWSVEIDRQIQIAKIFVLMLTRDYLASDFIMNVEREKIMAKGNHEKICVYPILARECAWREFSCFERIEIRPRKAEPIWPNDRGTIDKRLTEIAREIGTISADYMWVKPIELPETQCFAREWRI